MANCSSAYGHIEIKMDGAKEMAGLINNAITGDYYTEIDVESPEEDKPDFLRARFWGIGRWAYEANCRYFWHWLKAGAQEDKRCAKLFEKIKAKDFEIIFDFSDEEGGCQVLYEMVYSITHKAGEDDVVGKVCECHDYEYTPENLCRLGVYENINDAREACGIYEGENERK